MQTIFYFSTEDGKRKKSGLALANGQKNPDLSRSGSW